MIGTYIHKSPDVLCLFLTLDTGDVVRCQFWLAQMPYTLVVAAGRMRVNDESHEALTTYEVEPGTPLTIQGEVADAVAVALFRSEDIPELFGEYASTLASEPYAGTFRETLVKDRSSPLQLRKPELIELAKVAVAANQLHEASVGYSR